MCEGVTHDEEMASMMALVTTTKSSEADARVITHEPSQSVGRDVQHQSLTHSVARAVRFDCLLFLFNYFHN